MATGSLFVIAVAFTRVYLGLHWLSDMTASMLLGLSFGGMSSAHPSVRRGFLAALVLWVLPTLYLAAVCGVRITVPAPLLAGWTTRPRRGNLAPDFASGRRPDACHFVVEAIEEKVRRQPPGKKGLEPARSEGPAS
jgi:hypothetical protein